MSKYMNFKEAAKYLNVSAYTLRNWVKNEGFPVAKIGNIVRVEVDEMDKWIRNRVGVK